MANGPAPVSGDEGSVPMVRMGEVSGVHGVHGWIKVFSHARPRESIFEFRDWWLGCERRHFRLVAGRRSGKTLVARLEGVSDRDVAARMRGQAIYVPFRDLPKLPEGEYYWAELVGLRVFTSNGVDLGEVASLMETGANDVLVVSGERERLIPYIPDVVREVDLGEGRMLVDWDADF